MYGGVDLDLPVMVHVFWKERGVSHINVKALGIMFVYWCTTRLYAPIFGNKMGYIVKYNIQCTQHIQQYIQYIVAVGHGPSHFVDPQNDLNCCKWKERKKMPEALCT